MLARVIMAASHVQNARWAFNCGSWTPSGTEWGLLARGLDAENKEEVGKYVFQNDSKSAMIGRYMIRKFVCDATGLEWRNVNILRETLHKKPYLFQESLSGPKVQFNISHSGNFVILAGQIGELDLGVDLMKVEKQRSTSVPEFFHLMTKQFAPDEWAVVKSQPTEAEQMKMFYRFWCLKESYTKATGTGITVNLQKICFKLNNLQLTENCVVDNTEVFIEDQKQEGWKFEESMVDHEHIATVALHSPDISKLPSGGQLFQTLSFTELISCHQQVSELDSDYCRQFLAKKLKP